jgi:Aldehyde oxidase and xanthine dehydrogenase, a/b hammerhead domain
LPHSWNAIPLALLDALPPERLRSGGIEDERVSESATLAVLSTPMSWIGQSVERVEDTRLLSGRGAFIDDHPPVANIHHTAIVRSPYPHARILGYDVSGGLAMDGVVGVGTGEDVIKHTPAQRDDCVGAPPPSRARSGPDRPWRRRLRGAGAAPEEHPRDGMCGERFLRGLHVQIEHRRDVQREELGDE